MPQQQLQKEEQSVGELFSHLASDTAVLIQQEIALVEIELTRKATRAGKNIGSLILGGSIAYAALLAVGAGVIMVLSYFIPAWLSAMLVGAGVGVAGYMMINSALTELRSINLTPRESVASIKEDAEWLKNQLK